MAAGLVISYWSYLLPRDLGWASAPGLVPILFAGTMFIMALFLFITAIRRGAPRLLLKMLSSLNGAELVKSQSFRRQIYIIAIASLYILVLTGRVYFEIASFIFLALAFFTYWPKGGWLKILLISAVIPLVISFIFRVLFVMLVPGDSIYQFLY